jgi:hypothetical protein
VRKKRERRREITRERRGGELKRGAANKLARVCLSGRSQNNAWASIFLRVVTYSQHVKTSIFSLGAFFAPCLGPPWLPFKHSGPARFPEYRIVPFYPAILSSFLWASMLPIHTSIYVYIHLCAHLCTCLHIRIYAHTSFYTCRHP